MMVHFFRLHGNTGHKAKGFIEIFECECFGYCIAVIDFAPVIKLCQKGFADFRGKFFSHVKILSLVWGKGCKKFFSDGQKAFNNFGDTLRGWMHAISPVSYTHLTLPTIYSV